MAELIFIENPEALNEYLRGDATMRRAFWRAQTQHLKLSRFAEEYFRRLGRATKTPMLLSKGALHQLIEGEDRALLAPCRCWHWSTR